MNGTQEHMGWETEGDETLQWHSSRAQFRLSMSASFRARREGPVLTLIESMGKIAACSEIPACETHVSGRRRVAPRRIEANATVAEPHQSTDPPIDHSTTHRPTGTSNIDSALPAIPSPCASPSHRTPRSKLTIAPAAMFTAHPCPTGRLS